MCFLLCPVRWDGAFFIEILIVSDIILTKSKGDYIMQKNRLRELREKKGISIQEFEKITGTKAASISLQETGKRAITVETACIYCDYFGCSLDFLFCREDHENEFEAYKTEQLEEFLDILEREVQRRKEPKQ